jgi:cell division transport system ATP-binding protein
MITFEELHKQYKKYAHVFRNLSLTILPGEFVVLTGAPGSGKTTFLKLILNQETPTSGAVLFDGNHIHKLSKRQVKNYRQAIGTIFQDFKLLPTKTAFENIAFVLEMQGLSDKEIFTDTMEVLDIVGLSHRKDHFPRELSGGEKQKVAIARALIGKPRVILADEPTGSLDEPSAKEIVQILRAINSLGTTVIMTTHNDKLVPTVKGVRKINIKEGVLHEPLKGIIYGERINLSDIESNQEHAHPESVQKSFLIIEDYK